MRIGIANDLPIAVESCLVLSQDRHQLARRAQWREAVRWCARDKPDHPDGPDDAGNGRGGGHVAHHAETPWPS
jgi:hypothetical protein